MPATIADVARRAGVSTATVSRALSGVGRARPETLARVRDAARELGYRPSSVAQSLKFRTTRTLGLIITDIENPFFPQLVRAVEDAAVAEGYAVFLCNAADDVDREAGYLELLVDRRVDGVVIAASSLGGRHREWLAGAPIPVVLVNCSAPGVELPSISSDNRAGGRMAVEHLLALGHRRIGHITATTRHTDAPDRLQGARDALSAAGMDGKALPVAMSDAGVAGGERAAGELLDQGTGLTAIFTYNDLTAIGAMRAVRARGLRVPQDVSIVGFDDIDLASFVDPPLTTVAQSTGAMGRWAVERLTEGLATRGPAAQGAAARGRARDTAVLPVRLRVRASTGPAPTNPAATGSAPSPG
ncbi:MAG TPA: LacI family DNA-binding transcriptional regulator [Candidatus Limnocylindrales bacterium]|jgi:LacI family transcriptional regulator